METAAGHIIYACGAEVPSAWDGSLGTTSMVYVMVTQCVIVVALVDKIGRVLRADELAWGFGRARQAAATTIPSTQLVGLYKKQFH